MIDKKEICKAIREHHYVRLHYMNHSPSVQIVEPYALGYDKAENLILTGWYWKGTIGQDSQGVRDYLVNSIKSLEILEEVFGRPQLGYDPRQTQIQNVLCDLVISGPFPNSNPANAPK
jgi:hypothetical protein